MDNTPFNMLSKEYRENVDAVAEVAAMINNSGKNRGQRRRLEKALAKTSVIYQHAQNRVDKSAYKEYQHYLDENFRRFFAVLGVIMKNQYGWEESENKEDISELFTKINSYLVEYQNMSTDEVCKICEETTGLILTSDK